uniref:Uncharacterized protein n=1 Tax=Parascaris equorum TaxID=6256 RepID=A0A914RNH8_PAREQ
MLITSKSGRDATNVRFTSFSACSTLDEMSTTLAMYCRNRGDDA